MKKKNNFLIFFRVRNKKENAIYQRMILGVKIIIFVLYYLTVSVYTKTTIHLSVGGQR